MVSYGPGALIFGGPGDILNLKDFRSSHEISKNFLTDLGFPRGGIFFSESAPKRYSIAMK